VTIAGRYWSTAGINSIAQANVSAPWPL